MEAVRAAVERFGGSDVLVNDAANCCLGYFEELSPERVENQLITNLIGPMKLTCTPPRSSASRGVESPDREIAENGSKTTIVEPGAFHTSLLEPESRCTRSRRPRTTPSAPRHEPPLRFPAGKDIG